MCTFIYRDKVMYIDKNGDSKGVRAFIEGKKYTTIHYGTWAHGRWERAREEIIDWIFLKPKQKFSKLVQVSSHHDV